VKNLKPDPIAKAQDLPNPEPIVHRQKMNGKEVVVVQAKSVINFKSGFDHKLLCDGPTFSTGSACAYTCSFCYVPAVMRKNPHKIDANLKHEEIVVRRERPIEVIRRQLTRANGQPKFTGPNEKGRVIFASPLVDVAANMELVRETIEACRVILELTPWTIRLLSKSNLLPKVAEGLSDPGIKKRVIYGVSTGTLDDKLAQAFEQGTPRISKRLESIHWLQDNGFRTYGMICPSLPLEGRADYEKFARDCADKLRADRMEHVWAEVINVRGESFERTEAALRNAGFEREADNLKAVSLGTPESKQAWENYARETFEAHAAVYAGTPGKLRFLQYVTKPTEAWWAARKNDGAVLL
jgi:DNA repair photolyase